MRTRIQKLMDGVATLHAPVRPPRNPIVLCHGLYGFDVIGPSAYPRLQIHYWSTLTEILRKRIGAEVIITKVPGVGSVQTRAHKLHEQLTSVTESRQLNFVAHSMGGLDCRYLITHIRERPYKPLSLTTVCCPHRGAPFMDWCQANIGIGHITGNEGHKAEKAQQQRIGMLSELPESLVSFMRRIVDTPAYANLSTAYMSNQFNPSTPDDPSVRYYSVGARKSRLPFLHPLWLPKLISDEAEKTEHGTQTGTSDKSLIGNDGLVSVKSAQWGEFLGILEEVDHWEARGAGNISNLLGFDGAFNVEWANFMRFVRPMKTEGGSRGLETSAKPEAKVPAKPRSGSFDDEQKLRAALNWILAQINLTAPSSDGTVDEMRKPDQPKAFDLYGFCGAICQHLYDEGM